MNVLAAIFVAGVGAYTIYAAPRSWPHWLAGCAALGYTLVDQVFPFHSSGRGVGYSLAAALSLSAGTYLVNGGVGNLRRVALTFAAGVLPTLLGLNVEEAINGQFQNLSCCIVGLIFPAFLFFPQQYWKPKSATAVLLIAFLLGAILNDIGFSLFYLPFYFMSLWAGAVLIFSTPKYARHIEITFWHVGLVMMAAGFIWAFLEFRIYYVIDDIPNSRLPPSFPNDNLVLTELSAWLAPLLVAAGIGATCFAVVRLIPRQLHLIRETAESSDQTNPL